MKIEHNNHEQLYEVITAYVLGALEPEDMKLIECHLQSCLDCTLVLDELLPVASILGMASEQHSPPPSVKQSLLDRIRSEERIPQEQVTVTRTASTGSFWSRFFLGSNTLKFVAPVALAIVVVALGVIALLQRDQINQLKADVEEQRTIVALLTSPSTQVAEMQQNSIHGRMIMNPSNNKAYLVIQGLPPIPEDKDYQIWLIKDGHKQSAAVVHPNGTLAIVLSAPEPIGQYSAMGITREPKGGSPQPTSNPLIVSSLKD